MTKDASFKKVVRRHAEETGQRYTEALTDLEGLRGCRSITFQYCLPVNARFTVGA